MMNCRRFAFFVVLVTVRLSEADSPSAERGFAVDQQRESLVITYSGQPVATYVFRDRAIPRPHFAHVYAPGGQRVTRNHPPVEGTDLTDHATIHPGIWLAFGDLDGADFWRNKARVVHEAFVEGPAVSTDRVSFAVRNRYERTEGTVVCGELCRRTILVRPAGYLLLWDSSFSADREFYFGDQEEMGLGFRVLTPISVQRGGTMLDALGRRNEKQIWGNAADWCDYSGVVNGRHLGLTIMGHPGNFRPCWMHARDYGLLAANPFGRSAFGKGPPSKVVVKPGETLRLRYGVLLHATGENDRPDLQAAYADFVRQ